MPFPCPCDPTQHQDTLEELQAVEAENLRTFQRMEDLERRLYGLPPYDMPAHGSSGGGGLDAQGGDGAFGAADAHAGADGATVRQSAEAVAPIAVAADAAPEQENSAPLRRSVRFASDEAAALAGDLLQNEQQQQQHMFGWRAPPVRLASPASRKGGRPSSNRTPVRFHVSHEQDEDHPDELTLHGAGGEGMGDRAARAAQSPALVQSTAKSSTSDVGSGGDSSGAQAVTGATPQFRAMQASAQSRLAAMKGMRLASLLAAYIMRKRGDALLSEVTHAFRLNGRKQRAHVQAVGAWALRAQQGWLEKMQQLQMARTQLLMYFPATAAPPSQQQQQQQQVKTSAAAHSSTAPLPPSSLNHGVRHGDHALPQPGPAPLYSHPTPTSPVLPFPYRRHTCAGCMKCGGRESWMKSQTATAAPRDGRSRRAC